MARVLALGAFAVLVIVVCTAADAALADPDAPRVAFNNARHGGEIADALDARLDAMDAAGAGDDEGVVDGKNEMPDAPLAPEFGGGEEGDGGAAGDGAGDGAGAGDGSGGDGEAAAKLPTLSPEQLQMLHAFKENRRQGEGGLSAVDRQEEDEEEPGRGLGIGGDGRDVVKEAKIESVGSALGEISRRASVEAGDGTDDSMVQNALRRQVERLEELVLHQNRQTYKSIRSEESARMAALCEDTKYELFEQKRAFEELLTEKNYLNKMLRDDQHALDRLQERVKNPDLGVWLGKRATVVSRFFETPETDAVAYYAKRYLRPQLSRARHRVSEFEAKVEKTVDSVLPPQYGSLVAVILACVVIAFPVLVTLSAVSSLSKSISLRQYALLCNLFFASFTVGLGASGLFLRTDPLKMLYAASDVAFVMLQFVLLGPFICGIYVLIRVLMNAKEERERIVFGSQAVFYILVGYNYHQRVFAPALLNFNLDTSVSMYMIYAMDFVAMTALTVASAYTHDGAPGLPRHVQGDGRRNSDSSVVASSPLSRLTTGLTGGAEGKEE